MSLAVLRAGGLTQRFTNLLMVGMVQSVISIIVASVGALPSCRARDVFASGLRNAGLFATPCRR